MLDHDGIRELVEILAKSGWDHASIVTPEFSLTVGNPAGATAPVVPAPSPVAPAAQVPAPPVAAPPQAASVAAAPAVDAPGPAGTVVPSPSIGTVWRAPKPGEPNFVEVGQVVNVDDVVCLIEVMKLFTPVLAGITGRVVGFHVSNGEMVEAGTPIVTIASE